MSKKIQFLELLEQKANEAGNTINPAKKMRLAEEVAKGSLALAKQTITELDQLEVRVKHLECCHGE
ncbi:hypothetical protein HR060_10710 [Catenovulum sp. SM1970]|uniref:hypothetical protein n=1 Tax=Marinifaba aquimaris TaxID=2741323 RepID=UPI001574290F|nr:hypothetical protein [Marinifaba aquimaris]NTS77335.1 hypothetical protein [Marinifaba aquimaris]